MMFNTRDNNFNNAKTRREKEKEARNIKASFTQEISRIGLSLMSNYLTELELQLNGVFDASSHKKNAMAGPSIHQMHEMQQRQQQQIIAQQQYMNQQSSNPPRQSGASPPNAGNLYVNKSNSEDGSIVILSDEEMKKREMEHMMSAAEKMMGGYNSTAASGVSTSTIDTVHLHASPPGGNTLEEDDVDRLYEEKNIGDVNADPEMRAMADHMRNMTQNHLNKMVNAHGGDGSAELTKIFSQFAAFKQVMDRPMNAPTPFRVPDRQSMFVELRDMLEALPYDLSRMIIREQEMNPKDRIRDILFQRGCWPMIRYTSNRCKNLNENVPFQDLLMKLETYLQSQEGVSSSRNDPSMISSNTKRKREPGIYLLGILDPQHTTGYRLHQISAIVRHRNESKHMITSLSLRVGRLWSIAEPSKQNEEDEKEDDGYGSDGSDLSNEYDGSMLHDTLDFFESLSPPSLMLVLGANTAEKSALTREITRLMSTDYNKRTALVDTRSSVAGYLESPLETGQAVRFYVNAVINQHNIIDQTRSIFPQCVVVDEVLSEDDISVVSKLQSEGISCILGTNMHNLESLMTHPIYSHLLPIQHRATSSGGLGSSSSTSSIGGHRSNDKSDVFNSMSRHLVIMEMNYNGTQLKVFKNIPNAVHSIKKKIEPECQKYNLQWLDAGTGAATGAGAGTGARINMMYGKGATQQRKQYMGSLGAGVMARGVSESTGNVSVAVSNSNANTEDAPANPPFEQNGSSGKLNSNITVTKPVGASYSSVGGSGDSGLEHVEENVQKTSADGDHQATESMSKSLEQSQGEEEEEQEEEKND